MNNFVENLLIKPKNTTLFYILIFDYSKIEESFHFELNNISKIWG